MGLEKTVIMLVTSKAKAASFLLQMRKPPKAMPVMMTATACQLRFFTPELLPQVPYFPAYLIGFTLKRL